jgi:putative ABC transport system permease protein
MGIPLLRGRGLEESDRFDTPRVGVINETLRRTHFADQDPIGRQVRLGTSGTATPIEIVGVVGDVRHTGLETPPRPELFIAQGQIGSGSMTYFVRTEGDPRTVIKAVQEVIWAVAPLQTFYQTGTVNQLVAATLVGRRFTLVLLSVFAGLGLLLAAIGTYGVISFSVSRRTREVGIRMALGAHRDAVVRMIVRRGIALGAAGIAIGLMLTLLATPLMRDLLFVVSPRDTLAFAGGALVLLGAAALASWVPARRAARIDPMEALRQE